jgi:hypothetical protein
MPRLLLAFCLALTGIAAPLSRPPTRMIDPGLAMAQAAGTLCQAEPQDPSAPGNPVRHVHEHCLACPALGGAGAPLRVAVLRAPPLPRLLLPQPIAVERIPNSGRAAYASRAPPETAA